MTNAEVEMEIEMVERARRKLKDETSAIRNKFVFSLTRSLSGNR